MSRFADIGAAVIGTGFIGTVHVERSAASASHVRGVLGSTPERGAARADALSVRHAYASLDELLADPASTSSTSRRPTISMSRRRRRSSPPASTSSARSRWR